MSPERFRELIGDRFDALEPVIARARSELKGRVVWHLNSTARGGGVAEMLRSYLAYVRGAGVDVRWMVAGGDARFFEVTKRLHNNLHGDPGDGGALGEAEKRVYRSTLADATGELAHLVRRGDIVFLHDPQTAGMVGPVRRARGVGRLALPRRGRQAERAGPGGLGLSAPRAQRGRRACLLAPTVRLGGARRHSGSGSCRRRSTPSLRRTRRWTPRPSPRSLGTIGLGPDGSLPSAGLPAQRWRPGAGQPQGDDRAGGPAAGRRSAGRPGVALGPAQGPGGSARVLRRARGGRGLAPGDSGAGRRGRRRRPRGRRGSGRGARRARRDARCRFAGGFTWSACRWTTSTRTRRW